MPYSKYRKGRGKMKVQKKITFFIAALFVMTLFLKPLASSANEVDMRGGQSCGIDRGKDVIFVINDSNAMMAIDISADSTKKDGYVSESIKYTNSFGTNDRVGVIGFNEKADNYQSLTTNRYESTAALNKFLTAGPNTAGGNDLSTGIEKALEEFSKNGTMNDKTIIVMTTGDSIDNQKSINLARQAYEEHVTIHVFGFGSTATIDQTNLTRIAQTTGGSYYFAPSATDLEKDLGKLNNSINNFVGREVHSNWTLTNDVVEPSGLLIHENVKVNLNGYKLDVEGDLVLLTCAELRAVNGVITAGNVDQRSGSVITLNDSQLKVNDTFKQNGLLRVNGDYGGVGVPEVLLKDYSQQIRGALDLSGRTMTVTRNLTQEGRVHVGGGTINVTGDATQEGFFNLQKGKLFVEGNLIINGGPLIDDAFTENRSLNIDGGLVQVGSAESMKVTREKGNIRQTSGQLFVNHGSVRVFGDYSIADGWLTMIKGSMDTTSSNYGEGDGDYVHVYGDFSMSSKRNHLKRDYVYLGKPMHDQGHLTDGVLRVDGNFAQYGNVQSHHENSDKSQNYMQDYSALNFNAANRHKVLLTGNGTINVQSNQFTFNFLELNGSRGNYTQNGPVKWNHLIERTVSSNSKLASLSINDINVASFNPDVTNYYSHSVPAGSATSGVQTLKVDGRAADRNAKVEVLNNVVQSDGTAEVKVLVTAPDGKTQTVYTVYVTVGAGTDGRVTSIEFDQQALSFLKNTDASFSPTKVSIGYKVLPTNATNQQVNWSSTNTAVVTVFEGIVTPVGVGEATIVATTVDGKFQASATVTVYHPSDLLQGVKTLADFVSDNNRYDKMMSMYDLENIGVVVPGKYIKQLTFTSNSSGHLLGGKIETDSTVERVAVSVNGYILPVSTSSSNDMYTFSRANLAVSDVIEVIVYNGAGDELERIKTNYPVGFVPSLAIPPGYHSIQKLLDNPYLFDSILDNYSMEQLQFTAR